MAYARQSATGLDDTANDGVESGEDIFSVPRDCGMKLLGRLKDFWRSILPFTLVQLGGTFISHFAWQLYPQAVRVVSVIIQLDEKTDVFKQTFACYALLSETPNRSFAVITSRRYCKRSMLKLMCLGLQSSICSCYYQLERRILDIDSSDHKILPPILAVISAISVSYFVL
jgi:hypothetical protein